MLAGVLAGVLTDSDPGSGPDSGRGAGASPNPTATTPPPTPGDQAARWVAANLPPSSAVVATGDTADALSGLHRTDRCTTNGYVVADSALRRAATGRPDLARCLDGSMPVARFGDDVEVRHVPADPAAESRARAAALADRIRGGAALLRNPAIAAGAAVRAQLRSGRLDLRAETVLAVVASRTAVRIVAVTGDPAELAVGFPARTVLISVRAGQQLGEIVRSIGEDYRPRRITPAFGEATRLTWPFRPSPPRVLR